MDTDTAMLAMAESGIGQARIYGWDGPWVTIGRFQREDRVVPPEHREWLVRRPTGGKAVQHGGDVTVAIATPLGPNEDERQLTAIYRRMAEPIRAAMADLDVPAAFASDLGADRPGGAADCFAFRTAYDIVNPETGSKLCGCALRVTHRAALLQVSIPMRPVESAIQGYRAMAEFPRDEAVCITALRRRIELASNSDGIWQ